MSKAPTAPEEPNIHRSETRRQSQVWNRASEPSSGRRDQSCSSSAVWGACLPNAKRTKAGKILPTLQHLLFIGICWETNCLWELEMCALPLGEELTGRRSLAITRLNTGRKWINKISWIKFNSWRTERFLCFCQCVAVSFVKEFTSVGRTSQFYAFIGILNSKYLIHQKKHRENPLAWRINLLQEC